MTVTAVGENVQMRKCVVSKFQGRGIKITRVNSIRVAEPLIFFNILRVIAS